MTDRVEIRSFFVEMVLYDDFFCLSCTLIILYYLVSEDNLSYNDITYDYIKFNLTEPTEQAM